MFDDIDYGVDCIIRAGNILRIPIHKVYNLSVACF